MREAHFDVFTEVFVSSSLELTLSDDCFAHDERLLHL
jgi:hypothetical protein